MVQKCEVTPELIRVIGKKLHQPDGYKWALQAIVPHGAGVVVNYVVSSHHGTEYRCAGFIPNEKSDLGLQGRFDMIV